MDDGGRQLRMLARDLDRASARLRSQTRQRLADAALVMIPDIRAAARDRLPRKGGLNTYIADSAITTRVSTGVTVTGVMIVGRRPKRGGGVDLEAINAGTVRHPVFTTGTWMAQKVNPGFWDDVVAEHGSKVHAAMVGVMDDVRRQIETGH
jgi:hypothetical protein